MTDYRALANDANFQSLFAEGLLYDHILHLEKTILSPSTPVEETLRARSELHGITYVYNLVSREARSPQSPLIDGRLSSRRRERSAMLRKSLP